ncbi:MAG TPA: tetratricopeptide repeat protein [Kofleriaceae bacterium]|nr:tetratricopeptide repeat protein [Kofleriaceae bacterium]
MIPRPLALALAVLVALLVLGAGPASAEPDADARAKASAHFKQGQAFFNRGDFDHALAEYQAAFDLSAEPLLVFNIALCHDRANRPEQALAAFRRYLELAPNGGVADEAREDVARLTPIVDKLAADRTAEEARKREAAANASRPPPPPPKPLAPPSRVPLYIVVAGAAVTAAGATFHVLSSRTRGRLEDAPDPDSYFADRDTFKLQRGLAIGGYAAGAATMMTGLILGVTVFRQREAPQVSAAVTPGGAMVTLGWAR